MMNDFFLKTKEIIHTNYIHCQRDGQLELQDKDDKGRKVGKPVFIEVRSEIICLELDKRNENIFKFFKSDVTDLCKIADRILFYSKKDILYVFMALLHK
jgi:hypothetical protein